MLIKTRNHRWALAGLALVLAAATSLTGIDGWNGSVAEAKPGTGKGGGSGGGGGGGHHGNNGHGQGKGANNASHGNGQGGKGQGSDGDSRGKAGSGQGKTGKSGSKAAGKASAKGANTSASAAAASKPASAQGVNRPIARPKPAVIPRKLHTPRQSAQAALATPVRRGSLADSQGVGSRFRAGRILMSGLTGQAAGLLTAQGYHVVSSTDGAIGAAVATVELPHGLEPTAAIAALRLSLPQVKATVDTIYRPAEALGSCEGPGCGSFAMIDWKGSADFSCLGTLPSIGMLDTAVDVDHPALRGQSIERLALHGETSRALSSPAHGTAIASLLVGARAGPAPGLLPAAHLVMVDVFRGGPAGDETDVPGLIEGLELLVQRGVKVVNLSLAGPANSLLENAVNAARARGVVVVAAGGNDGPGAEPAYPAAYEGVVAVTAVDDRRNVYPRATQGSYIDLAAPGVGVVAAEASGGVQARSGTSYAAPFVTAAVAVSLATTPDSPPAEIVQALEGDARDLGVPGRDPIFGAGLVWAGKTCAAREPQVEDQAAKDRSSDSGDLLVSRDSGNASINAVVSK